MPKLLVGELAKQFGISPKTVHWYEAQGLLPETVRSESGYRHYSPEAVDQLAFVRKALGLGFTVKDIKTILEIKAGGNLPCDLVLSLLDKKIKDLAEQIRTLQELHAHLGVLQQEWRLKPHETPSTAFEICPLIEES